MAVTYTPGTPQPEKNSGNCVPFAVRKAVAERHLCVLLLQDAMHYEALSLPPRPDPEGSSSPDDDDDSEQTFVFSERLPGWRTFGLLF